MMNLRITDAVKHLIIINVLFFVGSYIVNRDIAVNLLAMHFPENPDFKFWQPITHMFMHGGIAHLLFNMFALYSFGVVLEQMWGTGKFLFFYISCGLGAVALHIGINYIEFNTTLNTLTSSGMGREAVLNLLRQGKYDTEWQQYLTPVQFQSFIQSYITPMLGASGAIYGIIVAFAFMLPNAELMLLFLPVPIKAKYFVPGLLALDLFLGLRGTPIFGSGGDGIAHFAHLGGALIGFIMMWYWGKNQFRNNRWN